MRNAGLCIAGVAALTLLAACAFPQPQGGPSVPMPGAPSSAGGASGPSTPQGSSGSSGSSGGQSGMPMPSGGGSSGSSGQSGAQMPSGPSGSSGSSGQSGQSGGGETMGGDGSFPTSGEPVSWPSQEGAGGGSVEDLDSQLDESLGDFDEAIGGGAGGGGEEEVDILDPLGSGSGADTGEPLYEEGDLGEGGEGGGPYENESIAQRAAGGAPGGQQGGQQGGSGSSGSATGAAGSQQGGGQQGGGQQSGGEQTGASSSGGGGGAAAQGGSPGNASTDQGGEGDEDIIPIPDDVGDGRNDDIVLRQIRDAAMKEKDPVLREKLWDEYRRIRDQR